MTWNSESYSAWPLRGSESVFVFFLGGGEGVGSNTPNYHYHHYYCSLKLNGHETHPPKRYFYSCFNVPSFFISLPRFSSLSLSLLLETRVLKTDTRVSQRAF